MDSTGQARKRTGFRKLYALLTLALLVGLPAVALILFQRTTINRSLAVGDHVPELQIRLLDSGDTFLLGSKGSRKVLLFFSVKCPHCRKEIGHWNQIQKESKDKLQISAISLSDRARTSAFVKELSLALDVAIDEKEAASAAFGVAVVPTVYLVDEEGMIVRRRIGESSLSGDREMLQNFLLEPGRLKRANNSTTLK